MSDQKQPRFVKIETFDTNDEPIGSPMILNYSNNGDRIRIRRHIDWAIFNDYEIAITQVNE